MSPYTVCPIPDDKIDQAFPVARLVHDGLALEEWRRLCGLHHGDGPDDRNGYGQDTVLVAIDGRGFVRGMCAMRTVSRTESHSLLDAPMFAISAGLDFARVAAAMLRGLIGHCRERQCSGVTIAIASDNPRMVQAVEEARRNVPLLARGLAIEIVSPVQPATA